MRWLLAASASCLFFTAAVFGTFVPLQSSDGVEYLFAAPPPATLFTRWAACVLGLVAVFFAVQALARSRSPRDLADAQSGRWLAPLAASGLIALGIIPAIPGVGERGAVVGYFLYDLRWWWMAVLVVLTCARIDRLIGAPLDGLARRFSGWTPAARLLVLDTLLFVGVVGWASSTAAVRFESALYGDEPKYVRFCEVWYQGAGLDISQLALVRDQPLDAAPALAQNAVHLTRALRDDAYRLAQDLGDFVRNPTGFQWNRALGGDGAFLTGIHGGVYEVYYPGVSAVLFPGYFLDRYLLSVSSSVDGRWPANLTMTNLMMLVTYGICAVLLFRLLRNALGSEGLAWIWAAIAMLTLPTAAFAFQLYPEIPALLIVLAVSNELLFSNQSRTWPAAVAGAATGALGWLHVRFLLVCLCLLAMAFFRKTGRARWAFVVTFGLVLLSVLAFNYHVTGSWSPAALWDATGRVRFEELAFILNVIGYQLDAQWGLLPHSLLLLLALPGLVVLGRQSAWHAAFVSAVVFTLIGTSSMHTLIAGNTTPDRLIVAVVPLLIWPVAVLVRRFWSSSFVRTAIVVLAVLSLNAALAYNWNQLKPLGRLRDISRSGWTPNLVFPTIRGEDWNTSPVHFVLMLFWAAFIIVLAWLAFSRAWQPAARRRALDRSPAPIAAFVMTVFIAGFTALSAATGNQSSRDYRLDNTAAQAAAVEAFVGADRCLCFTSTRKHVDWTTHPNSARGAAIGTDTDDLRVNVQVIVEGDGTVPAFGRLRVDFGDGTEMPWSGIVTERVITHTYARPGIYPLKVWFRLPGQVSPRLYDATVEVNE